MIATPLSIEDVIVGEVLWGATKAMFNASIVLLVIIVVGLQLPPSFAHSIHRVLRRSDVLIAGIIFTIVPNIDSYNYPFFLFITPMFLLSGTFFPLSLSLPGRPPGPMHCR